LTKIFKNDNLVDAACLTWIDACLNYWSSFWFFSIVILFGKNVMY